MSVMAKPLAHAHEAHDHEAELRKEHLLLDPKPRGEMNAMVMEMMEGANWKFWLVAALMGALVLWGLVYSWGMMIANGLGLAGVNQPVYWGCSWFTPFFGLASATPELSSRPCCAFSRPNFGVRLPAPPS